MLQQIASQHSETVYTETYHKLYTNMTYVQCRLHIKGVDFKPIIRFEV